MVDSKKRWRDKNKQKISEYNRKYYEEKKIKPLKSPPPPLPDDNHPILMKTFVKNGIVITLTC